MRTRDAPYIRSMDAKVGAGMNHLQALRAFNFVMAGIAALIAILFIVLFSMPAFIELPDPDFPVWFFLFMGIVGLILCGSYAVAHTIAGFLVPSGRGRVLQTVLALLQAFSFPIGTVYCVYAIWICWFNDETKRRFDAVFHPPVT